jgi:hypothetical protein
MQIIHTLVMNREFETPWTKWLKQMPSPSHAVLRAIQSNPIQYPTIGLDDNSFNRNVDGWTVQNVKGHGTQPSGRRAWGGLDFQRSSWSGLVILGVFDLNIYLFISY